VSDHPGPRAEPGPAGASSPGLQAFLSAGRTRVEAALEQALPPAHLNPTSLHQALRYAVLGGGKRLRPILVYGAAQAVGTDLDTVDAAACAVELIHAYSLVHDDLPAMDDDDLRRGRPTCHKAYDEATAILAGDAMQALAFQLLALDKRHGPEQRNEMVLLLARAAGSRGMVGGQAMDLAAEGQDLELPELENLHIHKTGALIRVSTLLGAIGLPHQDPRRKALDRYGQCIGLAFQIHDDVLDIEGDTATLGKPQGSDHALDKSTYPSLLGLAEAKAEAQRYCAEAQNALSGLGDAAQPLRELAELIVSRDH